jgi:hypothetical protein
MVLTCKTCKSKFEKPWKNIDFKNPNRGYYCSGKCYKAQFLENPTGIMRTCSLCCLEKDESLFLKRYSGKRRGQCSSWCKLCFSDRQMVRANAAKIRAIKELGNKCSTCNNSYHPAVYEFHHKDPFGKLCDWTTLRSRSFERIMLELRKCRLVCANCHRIEHVNQLTWNKAAEEAGVEPARQLRSPVFKTGPVTNRVVPPKLS